MPTTSETSFYDQDSGFWENYIAGRPVIPQSLFDKVFDYHARKGKFGLVHECGAGPAIHSRPLLARFDQILVTDTNGQNINVARIRLQNTDVTRAHIMTASLEDSIHLLPAQSVDLVFAANMMHYAGQERSMDAICHQLKPGGTFAALWCSFARLQNEAAQEIWLALCNRVSAMALDNSGGPAVGALHKPVAKCAIGLDWIPLDITRFEPGSERFTANMQPETVMWNTMIPRQYESHFTNLSAVTSHDKISTEIQSEEWSFDATVEMLRHILGSYPHDKNDPEILSYWESLESILAKVSTKGYWLVSLVLATRR